MNNADMAKLLAKDIDQWCFTEYNEGHRNHLGASQMGYACSRKLWYGFRWVHYAPVQPRQARLYQRGHREEIVMVQYLRGIGCEVHEFDTSQPQRPNGSYPQFRVSGVKGHYGGSLDCIAKLPERYGYSDYISVSFKTSGTGSKFTNLLTKGLLITKYQHHVQESIYCAKMGFTKYAYICANKNDDDLFVTVQDADYKEAERQEARAEKIVFSRTPPAKVSQNPSYFDCSYCDYSQHCHGSKEAEKNCRSCRYAVPVDDGQWLCEGYNAVIPEDVIKVGCDNWVSILVEA